MNRLPSLVSPFMATNTVPERTLRESYSTPATTGFPLWERTSAPCRSCWNLIGLIINSRISAGRWVPLCRPCVPLCPLWFRLLVLDPRGHKGSQGEALPAEVHRNPRSRRDARTGQRRLFAGHAATD